MDELNNLEQEINNIKERLNAIENEDDDTICFSYPREGMSYVIGTDQLRYVEHSLYEVWIIKPYPVSEEDPSLIIKTTMTRTELDKYISSNPGKNFGEYIFEVKPTLKQYL